MRCWNGAACSRDCIKPCRPSVTLDQAETIRAMAPTNQFFDDGDPRRAAVERAMSPSGPPFNWRGLLKLYMAHVLHEEGVTYVRGLLLLDGLTPEQSAAISEVEAEVKKENPNDCV